MAELCIDQNGFIEGETNPNKNKKKKNKGSSNNSNNMGRIKGSISQDSISSLSSTEGGFSNSGGKPSSLLLIDNNEKLMVETDIEFIQKLKCNSSTSAKVISIFGNTG